jgi:hypothetical protein
MAQNQFADRGFAVLVQIPLDRHLPERKDAYVVACTSVEEADAKIRQIYPSDLKARIFIAPMLAGDIRVLRLEPGEVRPWL